MKSTATALVVWSAAGLLASCTAAHDELTKAALDRMPVAHNTIVDCPVYDGMKKTSAVLSQTTSGNEVQVIDTVNAYFVRVRLDQSGEAKVGYMDRRCFGERGNERGNRKAK